MPEHDKRKYDADPHVAEIYDGHETIGLDQSQHMLPRLGSKIDRQPKLAGAYQANDPAPRSVARGDGSALA